MDITFQYDSAALTVICKLGGDWDWDVFYAAFEEQRAAPLWPQIRHLIVDTAEVTAINTDAVLNLKRAASWAVDSPKHHYIIITNRYFRTIYYLFTRLYPEIASRIHLVGTLDEALAMIRDD